MRAIFAAAIAIFCCLPLGAAFAQDAPTWLVGEYSGQINSRLVGNVNEFIQIKSVAAAPGGRLAVDAVFRNDRDSTDWQPTQTEATVVSSDRVKLVVITRSAKPAKFDLDAKPDGTLTGIMTSSTGPGGASIRLAKK